MWPKNEGPSAYEVGKASEMMLMKMWKDTVKEIDDYYDNQKPSEPTLVEKIDKILSI